MGAAVRAYVGLGANLGEPARAIEDAVERIGQLPSTRVVAVSSLYRSAPVDADGPDFLNAVAELETTLPPGDLLAALHAIEALHGRERPYRNAPRLLDLDLLTWGETISETPALQLPHPRMHARAFVLAPLAEIAPDFALPDGPALGELLDACAEQRIERLPPQPGRPLRSA